MLTRKKKQGWRAWFLMALLCVGWSTQAQAPLRLPALGDGAEWGLGEERTLGDSIMAQVWRDPDVIEDPILMQYVQVEKLAMNNSLRSLHLSRFS